MGTTLDLAKAWLRDFVTDGVPSSGRASPAKSDGRATFVDIDTRVGALEDFAGSESLVEPTWVALAAITGTAVGQRAEVFGDAGTHTDPVVGGTVANTGIYSWSASPVGWRWISADAVSSKAPIASPALTGNPTAPTPTPGDSSTHIATTAFVAAGFAPIASPTLTGNPTAPTPSPGDNDTSIATTAFVIAAATATLTTAESYTDSAVSSKAPLASPALTGNPTAPTPSPGDNDTSISTTAFVTAAASAVLTTAETYTDSAVSAARIVIPLTIGGTSNALTGTVSPVISAYTDTILFSVKPTVASVAGAITLQVGSLATLPVVEKDGSQPVTGRLQPATLYLLWRDSTISSFRIFSPDPVYDASTTVDGLALGDAFGLDQVRATPVGPVIAGVQYLNGPGLVGYVDRYGLTRGYVGDFPADEVRARDAKAAAFSASSRSGFDSAAIRPVYNYNWIMSYGQSFSAGEQFSFTPVALSTAAKFGNLMLGGAPGCGNEGGTIFNPVGGSSTLQPLVSVVNGDRGEPPGVGATNMFRWLWLKSQGLAADPSRLFVFSECGTGGTTLAQLSKGASPNYYGKIPDAASQIQAIASGASKTAGCVAIIFNQGQTDYASSTTQATWLAEFTTWAANVRADMATAFSTTDLIPIFVVQVGGFHATAHTPIGMAQIQAAQQIPGVYLVNPDAGLPHEPSGHLFSNSYRAEGNKLGQAIHEVLTRGRLWKPLVPYEIVGLGRTALVTFSVPVPKLQWQSTYVGTTLTRFANRGFSVYDDYGVLTVTGVKIVGQVTVAIACDRKLRKNWRVQYADQVVYGGFGNLCDSDNTTALDSYIYNSGTMDTSENIAVLVGKPYSMINRALSFDLPGTA